MEPNGFQVSVTEPSGTNLIGNFSTLQEAEAFVDQMRVIDADRSHSTLAPPPEVVLIQKPTETQPHVLCDWRIADPRDSYVMATAAGPPRSDAPHIKMCGMLVSVNPGSNRRARGQGATNSALV